MKCGDPALPRDALDADKERLHYEQGARVQTQRLVFWAAPAVCFALTVAMATPSSLGSMTTSFFASLQLVTDDKTMMEGLYAEGGMHQRSIITLVVFLYLPVLYLYRATGRLAKVHDLTDRGSTLDVNRLTAQRAFQLLLPPRSHGSKLLHMRGLHDTLVHYALVYLQLLWALNLYVYRWQADFWQRWTPKVSGVRKVSARGLARLRRLCPPVLAKFWLGKASSKAQEARRGGQKDWKKLKKAWALKSWADLQHRDVLCVYNNRFSLYRRLPLKAVSRAWGYFNGLRLPVWLRSPAFSLYIWLFDCQLHEAAVTDLASYKNLSEFFRRQLRAGVRPVDHSHVLTSPADGRILYNGKVTNGALEQVKGVTYSLKGFLGPFQGLLGPCSNKLCQTTPYANISYLDLTLNPNNDLHHGCICNTSTFEKLVEEDDDLIGRLLVHPENMLHYCIIYLAPGDYHRFHSPADWTVMSRRHFPGELFSVKPGVARWLQGLFNYNERAVYTGKWRHGFFSMTAVGATNVGSINVYFDEELVTNTGESHDPGFHSDKYFCPKNGRGKGIRIKQGQAFGDFNLGSTIVLLFEAPEDFQFKSPPGSKILVGNPLGHYSRKSVLN